MQPSLEPPPLSSIQFSRPWFDPLALAAAAALMIGWKKNQISSAHDPSELLRSPARESGLFNLVRITDADTIVVRNSAGEIKVRLIDIDCPERNQPFGLQALTG